MKVLGVIIFVVGIVLLLGNLSGGFRTFPYAGGITMAVGAVMWKAGK